MNTLYVLVGVPGSGKSTWVKQQKWAKDCVVVSTDEFVEEYAKAQGLPYSKVFESFMPTAVDLMVEKVKRAREEGKDIIWDQTSTTPASRARKFNMLPGYKKIAVVFKTPPTAELHERLNSRPGKEIPWTVVSMMSQQLEHDPPTEEEFDEIWYN